jgi:hypothetical protein
MIYLVKTEVRNGTYFKVGYAHDIFNRLRAYVTHNPNVKLLETVKTYGKTKHQLETAIHNEITALGYTFKVADNGITTEWFFVPMDKEAEFEKNGLAQFKACKGRKIYRNI